MQKTIYKTLNTGEIWKDFALYTENLSIEEGLSLNSSWIYRFGEILIDEDGLDISDIAVDECDIIYLIEKNRRQILTYDKKSGILKDPGCAGGILPLRLVSPEGIAINHDTLYIADSGDTENAPKVIALSRSNLQIRWTLSKGPEGNFFKGLNDIVAGIAEDIYVLEKGERRVLRISRGGGIIARIPKEGEANNHSAPSDIAVAHTGDIYILDGQDIFVYSPEGLFLKRINTGKKLKGFSVSTDGRLFAGEPGPSHPQKTIYRIMPGGALSPLWSYRGAVRRMISDSGGNLYVINDKGNNLTFLEHQKIVTKNKEGLFKGTYISRPLDSLKDGMRWHRVLLDGDFKSRTQVDLSYYISNDLIPDDDIKSMPGGNWKNCISNTSVIQGNKKRDALFQKDIEGRYLWFKIDLYGDENISPAVKMLTVFFPRMSYLHYLPAVYHDDPASRDFLERFLSIFESVFYEIDFTIDRLPRFFDAAGAPSEFLSWLESWLSISSDDNWPEDKRRFFLQNAISFYKKRGTGEGLKDMLGLFTASKIYIVENFHAGLHVVKGKQKKHASMADACKDWDALFLPPDAVNVKTDCGKRLGSPLKDVLYGKERFCFCVLLADSSLKGRKAEICKRIIEEHKPAHTCYGFKVLEPWFFLDMHTYLGVNTCLTKPVFVLGENSVIGRDTVLHDTEMSGQIERHSRAGIDTKIT